MTRHKAVSGKANILAHPKSVDLTEAQEKLCPAFERFLRKHRTTVGDVLLGDKEVLADDKAAPWTRSDMRLMEETIKGSELDDPTAISFFHLLHKLSVCWIERHGIEVELPKAALLIPEYANPFRMDLGKAFRNHRVWGDWLAFELADHGGKSAPLPPISSIRPLLMSAVLYGGVWNAPELVAFVKAIPQLLSCTMATSSAIYIGLSVPWYESGFEEFRCWQPDPLTAILLMRTPASLAAEMLRPDPTTNSAMATDGLIFDRVRKEFQQVREGANERSPCNFNLLMRSTTCIGYARMPGGIAAYASRRSVSHSLSLEKMQRISDKEWLFGLPAGNSANLRGAADASNDSPQLPAAPDWVNGIASALAVDDVPRAVERLETFLASIDQTPLSSRLIDYAKRVILVRAVVRSKDTQKNFARRTVVLASFMCGQWADKDPATIPDKELEASYKDMVAKAKTISNGEGIVGDLIEGLRRFHGYLRNCHGKRRLTDKGLLVPIKLLDRVDVDLLSLDEYREVRRRIKVRWPGDRNRDRRTIATGLVVNSLGTFYTARSRP